MGVLFEISIVCHVFVFVVLADGWGFSLFGGLSSGLSAVFSRVRGSSGFSLLLAFLRFGRGGLGVGLLGGFSGSGLVRPVLAPCGGGGRVRLARPAPAFLCGGWVRVRARLLCSARGLGVFVRLVHSWDAVSGGGSGGPALFGGWVCLVSCFVFAVVFCRVRGGVSGCFCFRSALPSSGLGGVGLGWGCFFSGCSARSGFVSGSGLVLFGEFDPGSGRTLAACLTHASRTGPSLFLGAG